MGESAGAPCVGRKSLRWSRCNSPLGPVADLSSERREVCFLKVTRTGSCKLAKAAFDPLQTSWKPLAFHFHGPTSRGNLSDCQIVSSAIDSSVAGKFRLSLSAACLFSRSSNFVGWLIGMSPGFLPFNNSSTISASRRVDSVRSTP
jgi:hypothetical protein